MNIDNNKPSVRFEEITPELARVYLQFNTGNRNLRKNHVKSLANDMKNGNFEITGQTICFDEDGKLIDGQHRLNAVIESNCTVNMLVVRGLKRGTHNIDVGLKRTTRDVACMFNENDVLLKDATTISASILLVNVFKNKKIAKVTNDESFSVVNKYRDSFEYAYSKIQCKAKKTIQGIRTSSVVAAIAVLHNKFGESEELNKFTEIIVSGFMKSDNDKAVVVLRNWLISQSGKFNYADRVKSFKEVLFAYKKFIENENLTASALSRNDKLVYDIEI